MKNKILLLLTLVLAWVLVFQALAAPPAIGLWFKPSIADTNPGDGAYFLAALATNAVDPTAVMLLTNCPAGVTNLWLQAGALPAPRTFLFLSFSNSVGSSGPSTPLYFDYIAWSALPLPPPSLLQLHH